MRGLLNACLAVRGAGWANQRQEGANVPDNVFRQIVTGEIPVTRVYDDEFAVAVMDAGQVTQGHVVVIAKASAVTLLDLEESHVAGLFRAAHRIARALRETFQPAGITIIQPNGPAGWQTVPHVHIHVLPRYAKDGVTLAWDRGMPLADDLDDLAKRIRANMPAPPKEEPPKKTRRTAPKAAADEADGDTPAPKEKAAAAD